MIGRIIGILFLAVPVLAVGWFAWRWGEEIWYGRYPVEEGYAGYWAADHRRAHPILRAYAKQGDPRAQTYVAMQYEYGRGTFQSERLGANWMREAADQDYPDAIVRMGLNYLHGTGVDESEYEAEQYFQRASDLGHPEGIAGLAEIALFRDRNEYAGLPLLERAIAEGSRRGRMLSCFHSVPAIYSLWAAEADTEILNTCLKAGLDGYESSLSRAAFLLSSDRSPLRDLERAYELSIVGLNWWPEQWEESLGTTARTTVFKATSPPPRSSAPSPSDTPYADYQLPLQFLYVSATDMLEDRILAIGADPTAVPDPPDFGPYIRLGLGSAAMVRAENAARAFLTENPRPGSWMQ